MRGKLFLSTCLLLGLLFFSGCGKSATEQSSEFYQGGIPTNGTANNNTPAARSIPSEAKLNFWMSDLKQSAQHNFVAKNMTECQLAKDPVQGRLFFSVKFSDSASSSSFDLRIITRHSDLGTSPISDSQNILGKGDSTGTINLSAGQGNYWNSLVEPNQSEPIQSQCSVSYTMSDSSLEGDLVCYSLVNGSNQRASGTIKFSCPVAQTMKTSSQFPGTTLQKR